MRKCARVSVAISPPLPLPLALSPRSPSLYPPLPLSFPSAPPPSLPPFFHCLLVFCALPVSQRIPLVAQLRDSAGKLRLFKARSAGKASSCWREAAWTWRTSPRVYTLASINTDARVRTNTHARTQAFDSAQPLLLACLPAFQT